MSRVLRHAPQAHFHARVSLMDAPPDSKPGGTRFDSRLGRIVFSEISRCIFFFFYIFGICLEVCGICLDMFRICLGHVQYMFGTCSGHVQDMFMTSLGHDLHVFGTLFGHFPEDFQDTN